MNAAAFAVRRLTTKLGAEISGLDLARGVSPDAFRALYEAFLEYQVLLFPPTDLPPGAQVAFARHFGEVQVHVMAMYHADGFPELYGVSPARRRSSTARSSPSMAARRTSATCTAPTNG